MGGRGSQFHTHKTQFMLWLWSFAGHVIYEMVTGRDPMTIGEDETGGAQDQPHLILGRQYYGYVEDESCKDILDVIFTTKEDGKLKKKIKNVQLAANLI